MWSRHVRRRFAAVVDEALSPAERERVTGHLSACADCRQALERHRAVAAHLRRIPTAAAPAGILASIERTLETGPVPSATPRVWIARPSRAAAAIGAVLLVVAGGWWVATRPQPWDVVRLDRPLSAPLAAGQWIETTGSGAAIRIGGIGRVDLDPGTRLQLVHARPDEHRLHLARGRISAEIVAPPRVFFVDTPASTVVDLGCAYTMEVDADGDGWLRVTQGWAALEWRGRASLVPAGASSRARATLGPGTPAFDDATEALRRALDDFDVGAGEDRALPVVLAESRERDTLTLWHLLSRVAAADRVRVFERLVALTPLPDGVTRDAALALDAETMRHWLAELAWTW